jgi:hypothetical protein
VIEGASAVGRLPLRVRSPALQKHEQKHREPSEGEEQAEHGHDGEGASGVLFIHYRRILVSVSLRSRTIRSSSTIVSPATRRDPGIGGTQRLNVLALQREAAADDPLQDRVMPRDGAGLAFG